MNITSLIPAKVKEVEVDFAHGIKFRLSYMSRTEFRALSERCTTNQFNPEAKRHEPRIDSQKLQKEFCKVAVKGWSGVTPKSLLNLIPIKVDELTEAQLAEEIPFSVDDCAALAYHNSQVDAFLYGTCTNASFFNTLDQKSEETATKNSRSS